MKKKEIKVAKKEARKLLDEVNRVEKQRIILAGALDGMLLSYNYSMRGVSSMSPAGVIVVCLFCFCLYSGITYGIIKGLRETFDQYQTSGLKIKDMQKGPGLVSAGLLFLTSSTTSFAWMLPFGHFTDFSSFIAILICGVLLYMFYYETNKVAKCRGLFRETISQLTESLSFSDRKGQQEVSCAELCEEEDDCPDSGEPENTIMLSRDELKHENSFITIYVYDEEAQTEKIIFCGKLVTAIGNKPATYAKLLDIRNILEDKTRSSATLRLSDAANGAIEIVGSQTDGMSYKYVAVARDKILRMLRNEATMQTVESGKDKNKKKKSKNIN